MNIRVVQYHSDYFNDWNSFLDSSRVDSILFYRNFMDYHSDRFIDHSLVVLEENKIVALFPCSVDSGILYSHAGLTFGGLLVERNTSTRKVMTYFSYILSYLANIGIAKLYLKQVPAFYSYLSEDEIDYACFIVQANTTRVDLAYVIDNTLNSAVIIQERRKRAIKKAKNSNVIIKEVFEFDNFWDNVLSPNLNSRFGVDPVHSLKEIQQLAKDNPGKIRQFEAWSENKLLAGTTIFESNTVAHAQYISATEEGRKSGAIDLLFYTLFTEILSGKKYFDFGIVNEEQGTKINLGLLDWKEGFGARAYCHRFYSIETANYTLLKDLLSLNQDTQ